MKLNLNLSQLGAAEILTKEEEKKVLGGMGSDQQGSGDGKCWMKCMPNDTGFSVSDCSRATYESKCPNGSGGTCAGPAGICG